MKEISRGHSASEIATQSEQRIMLFEAGRTPDVLKMGRLLIAIKGRADNSLPNTSYYYKDIGVVSEQSLYDMIT